MSKNLSQQVVLDRRGFVAATFATVAGLGLAGCSDTSAEAEKGSAASSKSSEDTEASTTLDAKAFDKLVDNGPKADDDVIAASTWATAVKDAGVFKIGGVQTSTLFSLLNEKDGQTRGFDAGIAQQPERPLAERGIVRDQLADAVDEQGHQDSIGMWTPRTRATSRACA